VIAVIAVVVAVTATLIHQTQAIVNQVQKMILIQEKKRKKILFNKKEAENKNRDQEIK
jgi:hypothetical protein